MDMIQLLVQDHVELRSFLKDLKTLSATQASERAILFNSFQKLLDRHTYEEEQFLYHQVEMIRKLRPHTLEGYEEHRLIGQLVSEMNLLSPGDEGWTAKFEVVRELIIHHLKEEEEELFPDVKKALSEERLTVLEQKAVMSRAS